ncbi:hypothetical protein [Aureimonas leprariae]|uniref:Uncharacterized protein n=1 Tax=Plantimonas leprariae TaxID=2615207 RepID=A0A7V7TV15_9HYPH|nr:hypothetical protein [Aureimonas leprariae]KAB0676712.1 hypothetical protein F6X38_20645 [Aureimonas leprariae]
MKTSDWHFQNDTAARNRAEARHMLKALADNQARLQLGPEFDTFRTKIAEARTAYEAGMTATGAADQWSLT